MATFTLVKIFFFSIIFVLTGMPVVRREYLDKYSWLVGIGVIIGLVASFYLGKSIYNDLKSDITGDLSMLEKGRSEVRELTPEESAQKFIVETFAYRCDHKKKYAPNIYLDGRNVSGNASIKQMIPEIDFKSLAGKIYIGYDGNIYTQSEIIIDKFFVHEIKSKTKFESELQNYKNSSINIPFTIFLGYNSDTNLKEIVGQSTLIARRFLYYIDLETRFSATVEQDFVSSNGQLQTSRVDQKVSDCIRL